MAVDAPHRPPLVPPRSTTMVIPLARGVDGRALLGEQSRLQLLAGLDALRTEVARRRVASGLRPPHAAV
jgi:hypothetical protein